MQKVLKKKTYKKQFKKYIRKKSRKPLFRLYNNNKFIKYY